MTAHHRPEETRPAPLRFLTPKWFAILAAGSLLGYYLLTQHYAHTLSALPFALLLLCMLIHIFMHGTHGHATHGNQDTVAKRNETRQKEPPPSPRGPIIK